MISIGEEITVAHKGQKSSVESDSEVKLRRKARRSHSLAVELGPGDKSLDVDYMGQVSDSRGFDASLRAPADDEYEADDQMSDSCREFEDD